MGTFLLICFVIVAAVILFWLIVWPALLLLGAGLAVVIGAIKGFTNPPSASDSTH